MYAWHFVGDTLRDGRAVPKDDEWLIHDGPVIPCNEGLHASVDPFDALQYAPGGTLCLVELRGTIKHHNNDKVAASERRIVARMDFTEPMRYFARMEALSVAHLWDMPDVVADYLMTGDESIKDAAGAAAWAAAWAAAGDAAWAAAWAAARAAARAAAGDAAWAAAGDAARAAAGDAAWAAAGERFKRLVMECFEGPMESITKTKG
jgi:hypothetical protein